MPTQVFYALRIYRAQRQCLVRYSRRVRSDLMDTESDILIEELDSIIDAMLEIRRMLYGK